MLILQKKQATPIHHLELTPHTKLERMQHARAGISWANTTKNKFNKSAAFKQLNSVSRSFNRDYAPPIKTRNLLGKLLNIVK